jgi:hypothetical protein
VVVPRDCSLGLAELLMQPEEIKIVPKPDGQTFECDADSLGKVSRITNQKSLHLKKS